MAAALDEAAATAAAAADIPFAAVTLGRFVGKGQFGAVYRGDWEGRTVAVKEFLVPTEAVNYDPSVYQRREIAVLKQIRHPRCIRFYGTTEDPATHRVYLVMELIEGGTLRAHLKAVSPPWHERVLVATQVVMALHYLHANQIIHRDVKTDNVLMESATSAKLCDFGFARPQSASGAAPTDPQNHLTFVGSHMFEAPEIMLMQDYDERVDIFSYGVVLCELLSRQQPAFKVFGRQPPHFGIDPNEIRSRAETDAPPELIQAAVDCCAAHADHRPELAQVIARLQAAYEKLAGTAYPAEDVGEQVGASLPLVTVIAESMNDVSGEGGGNADVDSAADALAATALGRAGYALYPESDTVYREAQVVAAGQAPPPVVLNGPEFVRMARQHDPYISATLLGHRPANLRALQVAWRAFLIEFRKAVRTRDIPAKLALGRIRIFRDCFVGADAITWLVTEKEITRAEANEVATILLHLSMFYSATSGPKSPSKLAKSVFKDTEAALYRFADQHGGNMFPH